MLFLFATARVMHSEEPREHWSAVWISHPTAPLREPIVLHFRKPIELNAVPEHYIIHVSADRRFLFYVNGKAHRCRARRQRSAALAV